MLQHGQHDKRTITLGVRVMLAALIAIYAAVALAYAHFTPAWQAPDEPAHFNYVRYLADRGQLPVLQPGDYPGPQVVPIPPNQRVADLSPYRYESHQPPLFYALAALVYKAGGGVFALRALSVLFGAVLLIVTFACARLALPNRRWLWLGTVAFVAFIPMHLFDDGTIENDSLANLVVALLLLLCLLIANGWQHRWRWMVLGLLLGAALLTKVTIYLPAVALVALSLWHRAGMRATAAATTFATAAALSGWWFIRNGLIYGWTDILVQNRQKDVAAAQLQHRGFGLPELAGFTITSFHSFWGQFGWMTVPLTNRQYVVLEALSAILILGVAALIMRRWLASTALLALGITWASVLAGDLYYNLTFVQPQGRYLYPALVPIGIVAVAGFAALFPARLRPAAVGTLSAAMLVFAVYVLRQDLIPAFRA